MLPRKNVLEFNPLSTIPWAFEFFGQENGQVSRLRLGKFTFTFKTLSIFQKSDRFTSNSGHQSESAFENEAFHRLSNRHAHAIQTCGPPNPLNAVLEGILVLHT